MAETKFTQADIDNLAHKLDQQLGGLSDKEKALLHGVFALAGNAIDKARSGGKAKGDAALSISGTVGTLSSGFKDAFAPGASAQHDMHARGTGGKEEPTHLVTWTRGGWAVGI